jgi:uncharacterized protein YbjT (DUF2867 family)
VRVLVIGGTGNVGSQVVRELLERGVNVRVMTSSAEKIKNLPKGAEGIVANLEKEETLAPAFSGVDGVFLVNAMAENETERGLAGVEAAKSARVKRIVYISVGKADTSLEVPHFASKVPVERAVKDSNIPYTILRPYNFFQNDLWYKDAILKYGVYPDPFGSKGISRVDTRDIAEAAAIALTGPGHEGETYELAGPGILTGEDVARIYSRRLGREVRYGGDDLDAWEKKALTMLPRWLVQDIKKMFKLFQEKGWSATKEDALRQEKLLGRQARSFDAFVAELAPSWKN